MGVAQPILHLLPRTQIQTRTGEDETFQCFLFQILLLENPRTSFKWLSFEQPDWVELKFHLLPQIQTRKHCFADRQLCFEN